MFINSAKTLKNESWLIIMAQVGIWLAMTFFISLFIYLGTPKLITEPLSWISNIQILTDLDSYRYRSSGSGLQYINYYIDQTGEQVKINGLLMMIYGALFFSLIIPFSYIVYMISIGIKDISYRVLGFWLPVLMLFVLLKFDTTYTIFNILF